MINFEEEEPRRVEHVVVHQNSMTAVAMLPPVTFKRRGPRDAEHKINLSIIVGFAAVAANDNKPPDFHFAEDVDGDAKKINTRAIARRVVEIDARARGCVQEEMVRACKKVQ